ncbi:MAG: hypothetical protein IT385_00010 [Deltaproteobacteria bacterium]|nr:hypothetical protein [Deltaproteobacteria bacterium]
MMPLAGGACGGDEVKPLDDIAEVVTTIDATANTDTTIADAPDDTSGAAEVAEDAARETWTAPPDRLPGERAPRTARCDALEPARCLLPWPSNAFVVADATRATGLALAVEPDVMPEDEGLALLSGDGFSRVTPIVALLPVGARADAGRVRVFVAEPGPSYGAEVALSLVRFRGRHASDPDTLVAYPLAPLAPASEHLVVVDGVVLADGTPMPPAAMTSVALGTAPPASADEAALAAYFAPARALLAERAIDPASVSRVWDFTTRSAEDARGPLRALAAAAREAVARGDARVVIEGATASGDPTIALVARGRIEGLPDPGAADYAVPFRVVVPAGQGDYRVVLYGHGTGGDVSDTSFDGLVAGSGAAKVNVEIDGWTGATVAEAVSGLLVPLVGTAAITRRMQRALAGIAAIQTALAGPLGDLLAADALGDHDNPAVGRRPLRADDGGLDLPIWAGGSLGGVIGMVYTQLEPSIVGGLLNVPGAGFTHWLGQSSLADILSLALTSRYPAMIDQQLAAAMSQSLWDTVDGAAWAGAREVPPVLLLQMSVGDPVMPNLATALVATSLDAVMLAPPGATPMVPVHGLAQAGSATRTALTEFRTDATGNAQIHGFAAGDRPAGLAARAQLVAFIATLWAGAPVITIPAACLALDPPGICDFGVR